MGTLYLRPERKGPRWWAAVLMYALQIAVCAIVYFVILLVRGDESSLLHSWWDVGAKVACLGLGSAVILLALRLGRHRFRSTLNLTPVALWAIVLVVAAHLFTGPWMAAIQALTGSESPPPPPPIHLSAIITMVLTVTAVPLFEECLFRGYLLNGLRRFGVVGSVGISGFLFALWHLSSPVNPWLWLGHLPGGLVLGVCVIRTGSVWPAVVSHGLWNLLVSLGWSPAHWVAVTSTNLLVSAGGIALSLAVLFRVTRETKLVA